MTAARPTVRPAERSVPRVMMIAPTPSAMIARTEEMRRMFTRFSGFRKLVRTMPMITTMPRSVKSIVFLLANSFIACPAGLFVVAAVLLIARSLS